MDTFEIFENGKLSLPNKTIGFSQAEWKAHPKFKGVEIKCIVSTGDTDMCLEYCLVRIAPNCAIGEHIHENQIETHEVILGSGVCINDGAKLEYKPGTISIMRENIKHEVHAGDEGLCLFAKFFSV